LTAKAEYALRAATVLALSGPGPIDLASGRLPDMSAVGHFTGA
jgi:hypothetical protein